ncbi:MAG: LamB/YcsF family protein, partial [Beijerinckiaceae bacterium]
MQVDLNSDMGEGFGPWKMGDDAAMLDIVTSANVACGWHAGDPVIMHATAQQAKEKGVAIGAHPGFGDLWGFGRRVILGDSLADIEKMVAYQIGAMQALAHMAGHRVSYVKPHGALSNISNENDDLALAIARGIKAVD